MQPEEAEFHARERDPHLDACAVAAALTAALDGGTALGVGRSGQKAPPATEDTMIAAMPLRLADVSKPESLEAFAGTVTEPPIFPFDLHSEPGLLGDIARWFLQYAFRPVQEFAPFVALATLAPVFGRRFFTPTSAGLNCYFATLADTGVGKEAVVGAPTALLEAAKLGFLAGADSFTSDSAVESALRAQPNFLSTIDEVSEFIDAVQNRNAPAYARTLRGAFLALYSKSRPEGRWTGKQKVMSDVEKNKAANPIYSPHLSILGCSTWTGFFEALTEVNLSGGFVNRFLYVRGRKATGVNLAADRANVPKGLSAALSKAYKTSLAKGNLAEATAKDASQPPRGVVIPWGDGGEAAWLKVLMWQEHAVEAGRKDFVGRAAENVVKIATIRALARDGRHAAVTAEDIGWAWGLVKNSIDIVEAGARDNMAASPFDKLVKTMQAAVLEAGPAGIPWSKVLEKSGIAGQTKPMVEQARERLVQREIIFPPAIGSGPNGGRPGVRLVARCFSEG